MGKNRQPKKGETNPLARWPAIRAAIIAFVVFFNVLAAVPTPGHVTKQRLNRPIARAELHRWVRFLGAFGIETDADGLADWYIGFSAGIEETKWKLLSPITWWMNLTKTHQGWRLFGMPDERPYALKVVGTSDGTEELLYQSGDFGHRYMADFFEFRRVRALYNPGSSGPPNTYRSFGRRVAERIFDSRPEVDEVKISVLRSHTTLPDEPQDPALVERWPMRIRRGEL